jgi:hypothetical protein
MKIESYTSGGTMRIDGHTYRQDLKIIDNQVRDNWWRKAGHRLDREDIADILAARPEVLVIGTGYADGMRVPEATLSALSGAGIRVIAEVTPEAVQTFNRLAEAGGMPAAAFHLTC